MGDVSTLVDLINVPLVFAFGWFVLKMQTDRRHSDEKREKSWMEFLTAERAHRIELTIQEREQRKQAMSHGMDSLMKITSCVQELVQSIHDHSRTAEQRYETLLEQLRQMRAAVERGNGVGNG